jgi:hypothetical protein
MRLPESAGKIRDRLQQSERDVLVMLDDGVFADPVQCWHGRSFLGKGNPAGAAFPLLRGNEV